MPCQWEEAQKFVTLQVTSLQKKSKIKTWYIIILLQLFPSYELGGGTDNKGVWHHCYE